MRDEKKREEMTEMRGDGVIRDETATDEKKSEKRRGDETKWMGGDALLY